MSDEFHGDETLLTSHETPFFSLLATSVKLIIFNIIKLSIKSSLEHAEKRTEFYRWRQDSGTHGYMHAYTLVVQAVMPQECCLLVASGESSRLARDRGNQPRAIEAAGSRAVRAARGPMARDQTNDDDARRG